MFQINARCDVFLSFFSVSRSRNSLRGFIRPDYTIQRYHPRENVMKKAELILVAGLVLLVLIIISRHPAPTAIGSLPKFSLTNIAGGDMKSDELSGKVLVVDFWASWCEPCKSEIPKYNKLVAAMAGKDFQMIGYAVESG